MADPYGHAANTATATGDDAIPGTTIRFFLSSTFADFRVERDVLQRRVFPALRRLCAASGYRLQPIDLRWGITRAANADRQTLRICFDELERCRRLSPDIFLLIQLGDRYGSYILPPQVPVTLVERLLPYLTPQERDAFAAAYRLDENAVPPEYALLRAEGPHRDEDEALRQALVRAGREADISEEELLPFEGSVIHREIQLGLLGEPPSARREAGVLCALRTFAGQPHGEAAGDYVERDAARAVQLRRLTETVLGRLPAKQVLRYTVDWPDDTGPAFDEDALATAYLGLLRPKLEAVIVARTAARAAGAARGRDEVALANAAFEAERAARVEARDDELARLAAYLAGETGAGLPLVVAGAAGSGKSTLLAEAASRAVSRYPNAAFVVRYIGVTPGTESLVALLNDLRRAIARAYAQPEPATLADENQLVGAVAAQLATLAAPPARPLLLIVDALDQLGDRTQRTDWLPTHLAPNVRVVISVLAGRPELDYLRRRQPAVPVLTLAPLGREAGRTILRDLLAAAPRRALAPQQEEAVLAAFAAHGLPLHLRLLASEARRWRSFDPPRLGDAPLPEGTPELLQALLKRLEAPERHVWALVARSLGDLAAARFGLAEDELLDLLSRDAAVRQAQHDLSHSSPPIDPSLPLPVAPWARLYAEVKPLLTEREADQGVRLYTFYHRQFRAAVEARYLAGAERAERHRALADYFAGQPWLLGPEQWNWRKVRELVAQQEGTGDRMAAEQTLRGLADELEQAPDVQADDPAGIITLIVRLQDHLNVGGYWRVGQRLLTLQLAAQQARGDRVGEGVALNNLGLLADQLGRKEAAARYYEQALTILRKVGDRAGEGAALHNLGALAAEHGQAAEAAGYYQQALAIRRAVGDRAGEGTTLNGLGALGRALGRPEEAAGYYQQALDIAREVGDRAGEGAALNNLGLLAADQGRMEAAAGYYQQALAIRRAVGDRAGEGITLNNLGGLADVQKRPEEAAGYYQQALAIAREVGNRASEGAALNNLANLAQDQGQMEEAARYYEQALDIAREVGNRAGEGTTLTNLGGLARERGNVAHQLGRLEQAAQFYEQAARYYKQALAICREMSDRKGEGTTLYDLGTLAVEWGRPDEAAQFYKQALAARREVGDRKGVAVTLNSLGSLADDLGKVAHDRGNLSLELQLKGEAAQYYEQALAIFREVRDGAGEAVTLNRLGTVARDLGRSEQAQRYFEQALAIFEAIGAVDMARIVRQNLQALRNPSPPPSEPASVTVPAESPPSQSTGGEIVSPPAPPAPPVKPPFDRPWSPPPPPQRAPRGAQLAVLSGIIALVVVIAAIWGGISLSTTSIGQSATPTPTPEPTATPTSAPTYPYWTYHPIATWTRHAPDRRDFRLPLHGISTETWQGPSNVLSIGIAINVTGSSLDNYWYGGTAGGTFIDEVFQPDGLAADSWQVLLAKKKADFFSQCHANCRTRVKVYKATGANGPSPVIYDGS